MSLIKTELATTPHRAETVEAYQSSVERAVRPAAGTAASVMATAGLGIAAAGIWGATRAGENALGMGGAVMTAALGCAFVGAGIWVWIRATRGKGSR